jgi:PKD repeat protein
MRSACTSLLAILSVLLCGCGVITTGSGNNAAALPQAAAQQLPRPQLLLRHGAYVESDRQQTGSQFLEDLTDVWSVSASGATAVFSPYYPGSGGLDGVAYAGYGFALDGYSLPLSIQLGWDGTAPAVADLWFAVANWNKDSWDWIAANSAVVQDIGAAGDYFAPGTGQCYVVIALLGATQATLDYVRIGGEIVVQQAPVAVLSADVLSGAPPLDVQFASNTSYDPDGTITLYEVDKDHDGAFEDSSPTPPAWQQHFNSEGLFTVTLRVTDDDGQTDTDQVTISTSASSGWVGVQVPGVTNPSSPVWDADSLPAVVYLQGVYLSIIRAQNALGQTWDSPLDIEFTGSGGAPNAALINGVPAVAYETVGMDGFNLQFVMAKDAAGTEWNEPYFVCQGPAMMQSAGDPQLIELDGQPAIIYMTDAPYGTRNLFCYRATNPIGTAWDSGALIGPDNVVGFSQPRLTSGYPAVAFVWHNDAENRYEIAYARATDSVGSDWGNEVQLLAMTPGSPGDVSYGLDLIDAGGRPAVVWCSYAIPSGAKDLSWIRANDADGSGWPGSAAVIYSAGASAFLKWPHLALIAGNPAVAFEEWTPDVSGRLLYSRALSADGLTWSGVEEVTRLDSGVLHDYEPFDQHLGLGMSGGLPAITSLSAETLFLTRR